MNDADVLPAGLSAPIAEGAWAGWTLWEGEEPFETYAGPFYIRAEADGSYSCGGRVEQKNLNGGGAAHGGALATFADFSLFHIARNELGSLNCVTVSLNCEFLAGAPPGALLIARGDVLKAGRSLLFVRGLVMADDVAVLNFSGVIKILRPR